MWPLLLSAVRFADSIRNAFVETYQRPLHIGPDVAKAQAEIAKSSGGTPIGLKGLPHKLFCSIQATTL